MAFFAFFMLPLAIPVAILVFRDIRRVMRTDLHLTVGLRLALHVRAAIGVISLTAILWLLTAGFLGLPWLVD
jgi:hypothetical protein